MFRDAALVAGKDLRIELRSQVTTQQVAPFAVLMLILFAVALSQVKGRPKEMMLGFCEGLAETMFKFTAIVMKFAPIGIGAAIAVTVGHSGIGVLVNLGKLVLTP